MPSLSSIWQARHQQMLQQEKISLKFPGPASVLRNYNSFTSYFRVRTTWNQAAGRPGDREPCDIVALNREAFTDMGTTKSNP